MDLTPVFRAAEDAWRADDRICAAAGLADLVDHAIGFHCAAAVVNERLIAGLGEGKRAGTAHAARGASDKGGLA
jgi:hypothetical protein